LGEKKGKKEKDDFVPRMGCHERSNDFWIFVVASQQQTNW
jgi:hypothetical protein